MVEEVEIKIEYTNMYESDPLKEDFNDILESKSTIDIDADIKKQFHIPKDEYEDNLSSRLGLDSDNLDVSESINVTWHDSIDDNGRLLCKFCDLKYSTTQTLRHHVKMKHPNKAINLKKCIINNKRNIKHVCHICKKRHKSLGELKEHVNKSHSMQAISLSCLYCNATFNINKELTDHLYLKHNRVCYIYTCDICGYRTIKKSHFIKHINTHIHEKCFSCKCCDYATNNLANLKVHEHIHTNRKPYSCNYYNCDYQSNSRSGLKSHQLKHYRESNTLYCDKCSYTTVYRQSLKKHLDSHGRMSARDVK